MKTDAVIRKRGRLVIPAALRERKGYREGTIFAVFE